MKKKPLLYPYLASFILMMSTLSLSLRAQTDLPQVFSPNAAELGKYGKIPVSYFNGLPNISIPLTELKAKSYTLPIYLTYHASGNKPDQHPGWVGLGWTLHAGGCISRIVNGMKDELSSYEAEEVYGYDIGSFPEGPGNLYHAGETQSREWDVQALASWSAESNPADYAPDEFLVNLEGIQASFYITGDGEIQISSPEGVDFRVEWELENEGTYWEYALYPAVQGVHSQVPVRRYTNFSSFILTDSQGIKYRFGGDEDAMEYSAVPFGSRFLGTVNTWFLTSVETPGGEKIQFRYAKDGVPVVRTDIRSKWTYTEYGENMVLPHTYDSELLRSEGVRHSIGFSLIKPSYLTSIICKSSGDSIAFVRTRTVEAAYPYTQHEVDMRLKNFHSSYGMTFAVFQDYDHYCQLQSIRQRDKEISLSFSHDAGIRLHLESVSFRDTQAQNAIAKYEMTYEGAVPFPGYNAKVSDNWGYYNGITYGNMPYISLEQVRQPNPALMKLEMLTRLTYPTGGYTLFEYDPHDYAKVMEQYPFVIRPVQSPSDSIAGGLRIRKMTDVPLEGFPVVREFSYTTLEGRSSGILSGKPRYHAHGNATRTVHYNPSSDPFDWHIDSLTFSGMYILEGEYPLATLSETNGNHVTYSRVVEQITGGGRTEYCFSNHTETAAQDRAPLHIENFKGLLLRDPIQSGAFYRGKLLRKRQYDESGALMVDEVNEYHLDTLSFVKSATMAYACGRWLERDSYVKIPSSFSYLKRQAVRLYPNGGGSPHIEDTEYTYDSHRRPTEVTRKVSGVMQRDTYTYTGNYVTAPYMEMASQNMIALPVEHLHFRKDSLASEKTVSADLTTWKKDEGFYVPAGQWEASLGPGVTSFSAYNGTTKDSRYGSLPELSFTNYDSHGNITLAEDRSGLPTTYFWTPDGCHPAAIFTGARNGFRTEAVQTETDDSVWADLNLLSSGSSIDLEFTCERSGLVAVFLDFVKAYGRTVWWRMDFGTEHQWVWPSLGPEEELEIQTLFSGTLPAGGHIFQVTAVQGNYSEMAEDEEEPEEDPDSGTGHGSMAPVTHGRFPEPVRQNPVSWGSVNVSFPSTEEQMEEVRADDCLFEDFEGNASSTHEGFHGGKSYNGMKTLAFEPYPDRYYVIDWQERQSDNTWLYRSKTVDDQGPFTAGNPGKTIDHVRVFPVGTTVESYTWDPAGNLTSRTDVRGVTESYEYDPLGRLIFIRDNDGNYVEHYEYNYQNK